MARKLTGNPWKDYENGRKEGYLKGYNAGAKEHGEKSLLYARHFAILALYNMVQNFVEDEELQNKMVCAYAEEQDRIYAEEFYGNQDKALQALYGLKRIYKELGLSEKYDFPVNMEDWE